MGIKGISTYPGDLDMSGEVIVSGIMREFDISRVSYVLHISGDSDTTDESDEVLELLALDIPPYTDILFVADGKDTAVILHNNG